MAMIGTCKNCGKTIYKVSYSVIWFHCNTGNTHCLKDITKAAEKRLV